MGQSPYLPLQVRVGYFGMELAQGRSVPILPIIEVAWPSGPHPRRVLASVPRRLVLVATDRIYKILDPQVSAPFIERDEPIPEETHSIFQSLTKAWGWWFLRLFFQAEGGGEATYSDFQVVNNKVFPLESSPEVFLEALGLHDEKSLRNVLSAGEMPHAPDAVSRGKEVDRLIALTHSLVGGLPIKVVETIPRPRGQQIVLPRQEFLETAAVPLSLGRRQLPKQGVDLCCTSGCVQHAISGYQLCADHVNERCESLPVAQFVRLLVEGVVKKSTPCYRCSKFAARYRYLVRIEGKERDVCMDCADEMGASDMFAPQKKDMRTNHQQVVDTYLLLLHSFARAALGDRGSMLPLVGVGSTPEEEEHLLRLMYSELREARVYELTSKDYYPLAEVAYRYIESVSGLGSSDKDDQIHSDAVAQASQQLAPQIPMPGPLPFPSVFVGFGAGVPLREHQSTNGMLLCGWLLTQAGLVVEFGLKSSSSGIGTVVGLARTPKESWVPSGPSLMPWMSTLLVDALNDFRTVVKQNSPSMATRMKFKDVSKKAKKQFLPKPFYTVDLKDTVVDDRVKRWPKLSIPCEWSHRWDVRGHERLYIRRGLLPLKLGRKKALLKLGFMVFEDPKDMTGEAYAMLVRKGMPPIRFGEWLACKRTRIAPDVKPHGRPDLPYVPSVHKPGRKLEVAGGGIAE